MVLSGDFEEVGSSIDIHNAAMRQSADAHLTSARRLLYRAKQGLKRASNDHDRQAAEDLARQSLLHFARFLDWVEDSERERDAHERMDRAGCWVRTSFGCDTEFKDGTYWITCPVRIAHTRMGFSIGGTARRVCSICGLDLSECPHDLHKSYLVPGGRGDLEWCRVCIFDEQCRHSPTQQYRVQVVSIIREMDLEEVSIVGKPANPEARILRKSIDTKDLIEALGPDFEVGMPVSCDLCIGECGGLLRPFDEAP